MRAPWIVLAAAAALLTDAPAHLGPHAADAAAMVPPAPYKAKEFTILEHGGVFHLFYMRRDGTQPVDGAFVDLGHATSTDLTHWTQQPAVLPVRPDHWDNREIWAPDLIERDGVFYLFYSAVTNNPPAEDLHQQIGLATSTDLDTWQRFDQPVFQCAGAPWTYCDPTTPVGGEFRDPFVMPDPSTPGATLMYFVARDDANRNQYLMGAARATGDLTQWTSLGSFANLDQAKTGSSIIENPTLLPHDGLWYLFYTTWNAHPIQFQAGSDPLGAPATWGPAISLYSEIGWARTDAWFGPETFSYAGHDYLAAVESDDFTIEFWEIMWGANGAFSFGEPTVATPIAPSRASWGITCRPATPRWQRLEVLVSAPAAVRARVEVRDVAGRGRRHLFNGTLNAGATRLAWDGADDRGEPVRSGVYIVTVETPGVRLSRRVLRLR
ncbi:MAG: family 43 glycosylhydrolase [Candidatus Eisenbacteria bacterium]|nr:family 43 glycosylhydrolase [Candidatus Eisenbacteria bacterium]